MIPPSEFIPIAESCGLIVQLGLFAMQRAAEDLAGWQKQIGDGPLSVSVNLSSRQLLRRDLVKRRALGDLTRQSAAALLPA
jgi:EAL domain-containing protein (putative c-di-GMP-specific phosphodiesterase class I)